MSKGEIMEERLTQLEEMVCELQQELAKLQVESTKRDIELARYMTKQCDFTEQMNEKMITLTTLIANNFNLQ